MRQRRPSPDGVLEAVRDGGASGKAKVYGYDPFVRLVLQRSEDADGERRRSRRPVNRFVTDGFGTEAVLVLDGSGNVEDRLLRGPATDQLFANEDALDGVLWALTDDQGSVRDVARGMAKTDPYREMRAFALEKASQPTGDVDSCGRIAHHASTIADRHVIETWTSSVVRRGCNGNVTGLTTLPNACLTACQCHGQCKLNPENGFFACQRQRQFSSTKCRVPSSPARGSFGMWHCLGKGVAPPRAGEFVLTRDLL